MKIKKIIFLMLLIGCVLVVPGPGDIGRLAANVKPAFVLVVDPGHGGPDSGAVAKDGTEEKNVNLFIAKALKEEGMKYGIEVVLTRETDTGLYEKDNTSEKWKKLGDLKERKRIIEEADADLVLSMHLNSFWQDTGVRGAQVFYPKESSEELKAENEELAKLIQQSLIAGIADGSNRVELPKNDIYLFKEVDRPTILVECGFLSNPGDLTNLKSEEFQRKIATYIMEAVAKRYDLKIQKNLTNSIIDSRTKNA